MREVRSKFKTSLDNTCPDKIHFQITPRTTKSLIPLIIVFKTHLKSTENSVKSKLFLRMIQKVVTRKIEANRQIKSLTTASAAVRAMTKNRCSAIQSCRDLTRILMEKCPCQHQKVE